MSVMVSSGFHTWENIWNHEATDGVVLLFLSVWKPDETQSTSFLNDFYKETIQIMQYYIFPIFLYNALYVGFVIFSRYSLYFWAFVFNYPIVSHCTKFVFQKHWGLEVIYILLFLWPKEGFASQKQ